MRWLLAFMGIALAVPLSRYPPSIARVMVCVCACVTPCSPILRQAHTQKKMIIWSTRMVSPFLLKYLFIGVRVWESKLMGRLYVHKRIA